MDKNQPIENFDAMLRQSLEGAKMPVPTGAWEAIGSSLGAKAVVAVKVASVKLILIKSIAAAVLAGGAIWGAIELFQTEPKKQEVVQNQSTENADSPEVINQAPIEIENNSEQTTNASSTKTNSPKSGEVSPEKFNVSEGILPPNRNFKDTFKATEKPKENIVVPDNKPNKQEQSKTETPKVKPENTEKSAEKEAVKAPVSSNKPVVIPDVFTPYDIDGSNDCFKVLIENEIKFSLQIYDNKGIRVFECSDKNTCWDGKDKNTGDMSPRGFYTYKLMYELNNGYKKIIHGGLNLL
jgi:hypothetical protein